ncbi:related to nadh-ubiquinone oxidoreductase 9.5 kDa subunit [Ustilago trichophora]|uniref:Related to nadh-ubiquinone oxidoreductase 9.5 kDa subunit n=1 Tax=Ustilago trichophora TaxID=86804 RepID=A0A5C3EBB2_9BASI|nr:related to nadh-ubiquinone oxidoreductase 9.5 kDa subunit [Ustilago trichophora]
MASLFSPFRSTYRYLQYAAHEHPVVFYSILIGSVGPVAVVTVPPIRKAYGWKPSEKVPTSYPLPARARQEITAYDDEE